MSSTLNGDSIEIFGGKFTVCRDVVRVGRWVQLHPPIFEKGLIAPINFHWKQGLKGNLHPSIEIPNGLLGALHPSIGIPNDAPDVCISSSLCA